MTSSSRVIKADKQTFGRHRVSVDVPPMEEPVDFEPEVETRFSEVVERAKGEARAILEEAETQVEAVRREARDEGYKTGFEIGKEEGKQEAQAQWADLRRNIEEPLRLLTQSREYMDRLNDESTLALAAALTMAVFSRLKLERLDVVTGYIEELAAIVDKDKVAVFLDPSWGPRLGALQEALESSGRALALAVDEALGSGMMRAESEIGGVLGGPLLSLKALLREVLG